jgi:alcohol dehydrogenase class IV
MTAVLKAPTVEPFFEGQLDLLISSGWAYPEACRFHVDSFQAERVYLLLSGSLVRNTDIHERLQATLGTKVVGTRVGLQPHSLWSELLQVINDAKMLDIDCMITVGAGSLTDAAKVVVWALANEAYTEDGLQALSNRDSPDYKDLKPPTIKHIAVPTSLSGGEFTSYAGATNDKTRAKVLFTPPVQNPAIVILDPQVAATTPSRLFLGTGIRAVDHCVETACSLQSNSSGDRAAIDGLKLLVPALLKYRKFPTDLAAVYQAQLGAAESIKTSLYGVEKGASHAIGHQLGPLGVPHGETSCILLPAVCKFNASRGANVERQKKLVDELLGIPEVKLLVESAEKDLCGILDALIKSLGLPRALKELSIGRESFDVVAENTLSDMWAKTNPVPLVRKEDVLEILEMAA